MNWSYLPLVICIVGGVLYAISDHAKISEFGRLAFVAGLLAFLLKGVG